MEIRNPRKTVLVFSFAVGLGFSHAHAQADDSCALGAYRSPSGDLAAVTKPGPNSPSGMHYTLLDGREGYSSQPDAVLVCDKGVVKNRGDGTVWTRLELRETPTFFESKGVRLYGVLLEPEATTTKPPLIVLVHGSQKTSPIGLYYQELFAAQGVATFAYDKRGTGKSGGVYTQEFNLLADDAASAARAARKLAARRYSRFGFEGGSQGGWVAPLAAVKASADFVEVGFGVAGTALEQDQWQVDYQLKEQGFPGTIAPDVHNVTDATAKVAASDFTAHFQQLARMQKMYDREPWFWKIDGQYSGELLRGEIARAKSESPQVPWYYTSVSAVEKLRIPQLWVLAQDDSTAPSAHTIQRLQALRKEGSNIQIFVFPHTDHGIRTYKIGANGARVPGHMADGYLKLLADWAKGVTKPPYGASFTANTH
jgi:dipeptidyl aminopeptidase/acylaminoacyl peptidase